MWCTRWTSLQRSARSGCARSWPNWSTGRRRSCNATAEQWTSSPATASWRCSVRRSRWRTTPFGRVWPRWRFRRRRRSWPPKSNAATASSSRLRIGLNSGQVIAGEIGSGRMGYTAIGEQVGMAQRMESVAPPGGVMLSESTARLVEDAAVLGEPELVHIKGADAAGACAAVAGDRREREHAAPARPDSGRAHLGAEHISGDPRRGDRRRRLRRQRGRAAGNRQEPHWSVKPRRWPPAAVSR